MRPEALNQAHLPICEGGIGLIGSRYIRRAVYAGYKSLFLGRVVAASVREGFFALLQTLAYWSMTAGLVAELKKCAELAMESQLKGIYMEPHGHR